MDREKAQELAFGIIGFAGEAFSCFMKAVESARKGSQEEAAKLIAEGEKQLSLAHNSQTELLVSEARGENIEYSIMLVHAQDHLMTTIMYERIAKEFIILYKERGSLIYEY